MLDKNATYIMFLFVKIEKNYSHILTHVYKYVFYM